MEKRERRIQDELRMKAKAKRIGDIRGIPGNWDKLYNHLAACSCHACRTPRRSHWFKGADRLTMQERRASDVPS